MSPASSFVLVFNCGSSSVKFSVVNPESGESLLSGLIQRIGTPDADVNFKYLGNKQIKKLPNISYQHAIFEVLNLLNASDDLINKIKAIGHRVVHGGELFTRSARIDENVLREIRACNHLAPLHNPANVIGIEEAQKAFPNLPHVAVFDTAFHQTMPEKAYIYPIPYEYYKNYSVRRYGFHGTSHLYVTQEAAKLLNKPYDQCALISAHLGNGCSLAAVLNGKCVDTTMGLTPLEGLVMGTRSGDIDPSIHAYLAGKLGCDIYEITEILNKKSGLFGISGGISDMREIEEGYEKGEKFTTLALEIFCYKLAKSIAALTTPLGRLDALIFTAGIGENGPIIREKVLALLKILNFKIDTEKNNAYIRGKSGIITQSDSTIAMVIPTNEEWVIAKDAISL